MSNYYNTSTDKKYDSQKYLNSLSDYVIILLNGR